MSFVFARILIISIIWFPIHTPTLTWSMDLYIAFRVTGRHTHLIYNGQVYLEHLLLRYRLVQLYGHEMDIGDNLVTFLSPHVLFAFYLYICLIILVPSVALHRWLDARLKYRLRKVEETKECYTKLSNIQNIYHWGASNQTQQHRMCTCPFFLFFWDRRSTG